MAFNRLISCISTIFCFLVSTQSTFATVRISNDAQLGHLILNGIATVSHLGDSVSCSDPLCEDLKTTTFKLSDVLRIIKQSPAGALLVQSIPKLPMFKYFEDLSPEQQGKLDTHGDSFGGAAAESVPKGALGNQVPLIIIHKGYPLFAIAVLMAHELQHVADFDADWNHSLFRSIAVLSVPQKNFQKEIQNKGQANALSDLHTYVVEYRAFSTATTVRSELQKTYPCLTQLWSDYIKQTKIYDLDPEKSEADRLKLVRGYIWGGNYRSLQNQIPQLTNSPQISSDIKASGVSIPEFVQAIDGAVNFAPNLPAPDHLE